MPRSNTQLQADVEQELKYEPSVDPSDIGVTAKNGVVSLTGNVRSYADKNAAVHEGRCLLLGGARAGRMGGLVCTWSDVSSG